MADKLQTQLITGVLFTIPWFVFQHKGLAVIALRLDVSQPDLYVLYHQKLIQVLQLTLPHRYNCLSSEECQRLIKRKVNENILY